MSYPSQFSQALLNQILRETAEKICKQIYYAKIYYKDKNGHVVSADTIGRVNTGDQKTKVVYIPRRHRAAALTAEIHYLDESNNSLMWTDFGHVVNGSIITFTVIRPEDVSYM